MSLTYSDLGWTPFFQNQQDAENALVAYRVSAVHRSTVTGLSPKGTARLTLPPEQITSGFAVGDWVLTDDDLQIVKLLDRQSTLRRNSAASAMGRQLIATNVDTLMITTSCNDDFNIARLERYLALAHQAGCEPVILLTKADTCSDASAYRDQADALLPDLQVLAINAHDPEDIAALLALCPKGKTTALVGSSGVGKTTLANGLTQRSDATAAIRESDARGRHTTTARHLRQMTNGGWLIDTPGMRALPLKGASDAIEAVYSEFHTLAQHCKFSDCKHEGEPGCVVQAAVDAGDLDEKRFLRWKKLLREDEYNSLSAGEARRKDKHFNKMARPATRGKKRKRR
ncbi:ribosome small subunit-dependent GTPase A [Epibacterium ulvae]|uniref:ribosome small subunit-dependent GTPase A n=1 Tax=Epibacterium ulvae TaxID=1156985 RepID=UPI0024933237|nr:ribosome small subunit-dependent GTPase A [Epibacterium ulvae]